VVVNEKQVAAVKRTIKKAQGGAPSAQKISKLFESTRQELGRQAARGRRAGRAGPGA
jgi:hypothetical protein